MDGKDVANRFRLPQFQISGRTNAGRIRVYCMGFVQAENIESVTWILLQFKKFVPPSNCVALTPKLIASDGTDSIITPVRNIFPNSKLLLDNWNLNQNQNRHVRKFTRHNNFI